jgi:prepilin-type N-terminal cleavage/methylation domain-containing protein
MKISSPKRFRASAGFTMVEIAISLAIIGIALVAIIGVLPMGLRVQSDNREQTIINQDATVLMQAVTSGSRGMDDLTNYVYAITNYWKDYASGNTGINGYTFATYSISPGCPIFGSALTNGANIVGLLSTPEYTDGNGYPQPNLINGVYSNHVVAYVRSMSGPATEKPPQNNPLMLQNAFSYIVICANLPVQSDTNNVSPYTRALQENLRELRLTYLWPLLPNGGIGFGNQTFRTMVSGQLNITPVNSGPSPNLYFFQSFTFTNAP